MLHAQLNGNREKYNFNTSWQLWVGDDTAATSINYDDYQWKKVTLPHAWNEDDAFRVSIDKLRSGIVWYRKHFRIPKEKKGKKIFIEFEGIRQGGEFFLNGKSIGLSENGVMAFGFDISDLVKFDEDNVLAARIDNNWNYRERKTNSPYEWNDKNFYANYGGINKNVWLHITDKVYQTLPLFSNLGTTGVYVYATDFNILNKSAVIHTESQVKNETATPVVLQYTVSIEDAVSKKIISSFGGESKSIQPLQTLVFSAKNEVSDLNFWSWGYGYLYNVYTVLKVGNKVVDVVKTTTGFRKTSFENGYLSLNDRAIQIKGYAQRTTNEWPALGQSVPAWMSDYSNKLMVDGNANLVRWMHVTPWKQDVESCDRVGLMEAMPAGDAEKDVDGRRWEQRKEVMRDATIYNRNNPSVVFYECGNNEISEEHMKEMKAIRDQYDANGGRAIGSRNMLNSKVAEYGGEMLYINKSATKPMWQMEYSRDEGLRKYWDDYTPPYHKDGDGPLYKGQPAKEYNRNQESHAVQDVVRWDEYYVARPGTGKRVNAGGVNIIFSESNTHHRGEENYRTSGEVDALRILKQNYYANQVMWNGWVDNEKPGIHIIGHWNYDNNVTKDIYVVSTAAKVELFVNGKSLGLGEKQNDFLFVFKNVIYSAGTIAAKGFDENGKYLCSDEIKTVGKPYAIKLKTITHHELTADGADVALIEVEVVDKDGQRCPTAMDLIHFEMEGAGEWRGGIAQGKDNYILSKDLPVECGVNRVLVRSTTQPGTISVKAHADGLQMATLSLRSSPFVVEDGLATAFPSDSLRSNLERGATPTTPSFTQKRIALNIAKVNAGSNVADAYKSFDDDESTDWYNDGHLNTAWISYELDKENTIDEVVLKLNNFKTRSYPLCISVDGNPVWKGTTDKTLGYYTIHFNPVKGKNIKIELLNEVVDSADYSVEVNGKKLDDGVMRDDAKSKGRLSIIEAEIYQ
ncbi:MAG: DUF4982 domain-containing protein [Chitinophagaceae bacterium]